MVEVGAVETAAAALTPKKILMPELKRAKNQPSFMRVAIDASKSIGRVCRLCLVSSSLAR
jgi:hypothetical protein